MEGGGLWECWGTAGGTWEETRREEGGPRTQGPSVPVLVPSLLTVGCGEGHRTVLFVSCPLGKAESSAPLFYDSSLITEGSRGVLEF